MEVYYNLKGLYIDVKQEEEKKMDKKKTYLNIMLDILKIDHLLYKNNDNIAIHRDVASRTPSFI